MDNSQKKILKLCVIGDSGVGKTSLIMRFIKNLFQETYKITVGADLFSKEVTHNNQPYTL